MKRRGILNDALSGHLARLGHTDTVVVADCGLPRPAGVPVVDLALTFGVPAFAEVVDALATEIVVESAAVARETAENNPAARDLLLGHFGEPRWLTHQEPQGGVRARGAVRPHRRGKPVRERHPHLRGAVLAGRSAVGRPARRLERRGRDLAAVRGSTAPSMVTSRVGWLAPR